MHYRSKKITQNDLNNTVFSQGRFKVNDWCGNSDDNGMIIELNKFIYEF